MIDFRTDLRTDTDDFLFVYDLCVLAMVVLTLISELHHSVRREMMFKTK